MINIIFEALIINMSLCLDAFAAGIALGAERIRVPLFSLLIIDFMCAALLALSLLLGRGIGMLINAEDAAAVSALLLIIIGIYKIGAGDMSRPCDADKDRSRHISSAEAAVLALALSADGIAVGLGAGLHTLAAVWIILLSLVINGAAIISGIFLGRKFAAKMKLGGAALAGIMLIALALWKIYG